MSHADNKGQQYDILLSKLCHYGIHGLANKWYEWYLAEHKQCVSINGFESGISSVTCVVPQRSVFKLSLFQLYINDLHVAIKYYKVHHTNLLNISKWFKKLNILLNIDLKKLASWLNAYKFSLIV